MTLRQTLPVLFAALAALGGCSYAGGDIGDPIHRKFHWVSFVSGDDIKASCAADTPDRVRLVQNAVWGQQVRIYEWDSIRRDLRIRVVGPGNLTGITLSDPVAGWRAEEAHAPLDQSAYERLDKALADSGGFGPPMVGLELPARSHYWTAATCRQGRFSMTGWGYPSPAYDGLRFPAILAALDPGRDTIAKPGPVPYDITWEAEKKRGAVADFTFKIGPDGLVR